MNKKSFVTTIIILTFAIAYFSTAVSANTEETLRIHGSSTVYPVIEEGSRRYFEYYPHISFDLGAAGSGTGIAMLISGETDIGAMSRLPKTSELEQADDAGVDVHITVVGVDGIVIVVHLDNPVSELTIEQITGIYNGTYTNWQDVGGDDQDIKVVERDANSGTHDFFNEFFLDGGDVPQDEVADHAQTASHPETVNIIRTEENAIGYIGLAYLDDTMKDVAINGVSPSVSAIISGDYPVARDLYLVTNGVPTGLAAQFIDFLLGIEGQSIVYYVGYIPVGVNYYTDYSPEDPLRWTVGDVSPSPMNMVAIIVAVIATASVSSKIAKSKSKR